MMHWSKLLVVAVMIGGVVLLAQQMFPSRPAASGVPVLVVPAALSDQARIGKAAFDANCAPCHGVNGAGTDKGPPFIHPI